MLELVLEILKVQSFRFWASLDQIQHLVLGHSEAICWYEVIPTEVPSFSHSWIADRRSPFEGWLFDWLRIMCALTTSRICVVNSFISSRGMIIKATRLFLA